MGKRDNFTQKTKRILAQRAGNHCSNPDCRALAVIPSRDPDKLVLLGDAAHITGAREGGPRYDRSLTPAERKSPSNGIWLCTRCARLVDHDRPEDYSVGLLLSWKEAAEAAVRQAGLLYAPLNLGGVSSATERHITSKYNELAEHVSDTTEKELAHRREKWLEGRGRKADDWINKVKADTEAWSALRDRTKARVMRLEAELLLEEGGKVREARDVLEQAKRLDSRLPCTPLEAVLVYHEDGAEKALALLEGHSDVDSINLRAAILHEQGKVDEARRLLSLEGAGLTPNAETHRILALSYRATGDLDKAHLEIQKALEKEPKWENLLFISSAISYFRTLVPSAVPKGLVPWPIPVQDFLVKSEKISLTELRSAENRFQKLIKLTGKKSPKRQRYQAWRLACLAIDPQRQEEAVRYSNRILKDSPTHYQALTWAIANDYDVDLTQSIKALENLVYSQEGDTDHYVALALAYFASGDARKAAHSLEQQREFFAQKQQEGIWLHWYGQLLAKSEDFQTAHDRILELGSEDDVRHPLTLLFQAQAQKTGDWKPFAEHLEKCYAKTGEPETLYHLCGAKAQCQDWAFIAGHAEDLVKSIPTPKGIGLAALATYNVGDFTKCRRILEENRDIFPQMQLPPHLRRLRIQCLISLGVLSEAVLEAETLTNLEPNLRNMMDLGALYLRKGDLAGLESVAKRVMKQSSLTGEAALFFAKGLALDYPDLGRELWRKSVELGLSDDQVGSALALAFSLGLDSEVHPLEARIIMLAKEGRCGIETFSFADMRDFLIERRDHLEKLGKLYESARLPIHIIVGRAGRTLAELYHDMLCTNSEGGTPASQPMLLARYGGRGLTEGFPEPPPKRRLVMDITALLLAHHLEILDYVEEVFKPILIPEFAVQSLLAMREHLAPSQPALVELYKNMRKLKEQGIVLVESVSLPEGYENSALADEMGENWVALLEKAKSEKGVLLDHFPLNTVTLSGPPQSLAENDSEVLVSCRSVLKVLLEGGPLTKDEYNRAIAAVGEGEGGDQRPIPRQGSILYLATGMLESLALAGVLRTICDRFQVRISETEYNRIQGGLIGRERMDALGRWVDRLRERIVRGQEEGLYQLISFPPKAAELLDKSGRDSDVGCLLTLAEYEAEEGDVIWIDDRHMNGYASRDAMVPFIDCLEVLKALVGAGKLSEQQYYEKLLMLRAGNVRFIPVAQDEILFHLGKANIPDGELVETKALELIRRYVAACLLSGEILQRPSMLPGSPNQEGEIRFSMTLRRAITSSIPAIWAIPRVDDETARARSEWVLNALYFDHLADFNLSSVLPESMNVFELVSLSLGELVVGGFDLPHDGVNGDASVRVKYFRWLEERLLARKFLAEPNLPVAIAEFLKKFLTVVKDKDALPNGVTFEQYKATMMLFMQKLFDELPKPLRDEFWKDRQFMLSVGIKPYTAITIDALHFEPDQFYRAVAEAINGRNCEITSIETEPGDSHRVTFEPIEGEKRGFSLEHPFLKKRKNYVNEVFEILQDSVEAREQALRRHPSWFDCRSEERERGIAKIATTEDPATRVELVNGWIQNSAAEFYNDLHKSLRERGTINFLNLRPPSARGLLNYFRLEADTGRGTAFVEGLEDASSELESEMGLAGAFHGLSHLPVPLPASLEDSAKKLTEEERRNCIKELLTTAGSPLSRIHLIRLLLHAWGDDTRCIRLSRRIALSILSDEGKREAEAFLAILRWVSEDFGQWPEMRQVPAHLRLVLVWGHADNLYRMFHALGIPDEWLAETFGPFSHLIPHETFSREPDYWYDILHPRRVCRLGLTFDGLGYAVGDRGERFVDLSMRKILAQEAFQDLDGKQFPQIKLLVDPSLSPNSTGSFLGGDRGSRLESLVGGEAAKEYSHASLMGLVEKALDNLQSDPGNTLAWQLMSTITGDQSLPDSLQPKRKTLLFETDYTGLVKHNFAAGLFAITFATDQQMRIRDDVLQERLENHLLKSAEFFDSDAARTVLENQRGGIGFLIELALNLALASDNKGDAHRVFALILEQLFAKCPPILRLGETKNLLLRLCECLPVEQARPFWPLLVRVRADGGERHRRGKAPA